MEWTEKQKSVGCEGFKPNSQWLFTFKHLNLFLIMRGLGSPGLISLLNQAAPTCPFQSCFLTEGIQ